MARSSMRAVLTVGRLCRLLRFHEVHVLVHVFPSEDDNMRDCSGPVHSTGHVLLQVLNTKLRYKRERPSHFRQQLISILLKSRSARWLFGPVSKRITK